MIADLKVYRREWAKERRKKKLEAYQASNPICKGCNMPFIPSKIRQIFHSKECAIKYFTQIHNKRYTPENLKSLCSWKHKSIRICLNCNNEFKSYGNWNRVCPHCKKDPVFSRENVLYA